MRKHLPTLRHLLSAAVIISSAGFYSTDAQADNIFVSYGVKTDDPVYPYTGFSVNEDVDEFNLAIKYTSDMLSPYAGGKIRNVHIGWSGIYQLFTPTANVFIRKSLNGDNLTSAEVPLEGPSGWNIAEFSEPYTIGENDEIIVGYTVEMWEGVFGPCTLTWGSFPEDTHFVSRNDITGSDGNPEWIDLSEPGMMDMACPVMMVLEVEVGGDEYRNNAVITKVALPAMLTAGKESGGAMKVANTGSNDIESVTISYFQGDNEVYSNKYDLANPIAVGKDALMAIPVVAAGKGDVDLRITEVNGVSNGEDGSVTFTPIVVPQDVAGKYTRRPLLEYFASESEYRSYNYDSEIVTPNLASYRDRISRIDWHFDDQFQLGLADDKDEVLDFMVEIVKNDSLAVTVPNVCLDRDINLGIEPSYSINSMTTPLVGILFSPAAEMSYEYALSQPTFAGLDVKATLKEDVITVEVDGEADLSVLPDGEELMLTVVLVEDGIETDSQEMPGGSGEAPNPGHAIHNNLVRQRLTGMWGNPIKFNDGKFYECFTTYLDYDNVASNMRAVAFINRCKDNGLWQRNIINSAECGISSAALDKISADTQKLMPVVAGRDIVAPDGTSIQVSTTSGNSVAPRNLPTGIYIARVTGSDGTSASFKIYIK